MKSKLNYFQRVVSAYFFKRGQSQLSFWYENPTFNEEAFFDWGTLGPYYMTFADKAKYSGPFDEQGVPLLDYQGKIGKQYNPIAISQYGLAYYNLYKKTVEQKFFNVFLKQADWLVSNLEQNQWGLKVWMHHFDFEYKKKLKVPWYSALAQGQGISLLSRAYLETKDEKYLGTVREAFLSLNTEIKNGGVKFIDESGDIWLEEYIVEPPTHILNGFIWALWGIYDYYLLAKDLEAKNLFAVCTKTIEKNLQKYDTEYWSLYDLSKQFLKNLASHFYHRLHIVQLKILARMANKQYFEGMAGKWQKYQNKKINRLVALICKGVFKIFYW